MKIKGILVFLIALLAVNAFAQSRKNSQRTDPAPSRERSTSLHPYYPQEEYSRQSTKKKKKTKTRAFGPGKKPPGLGNFETPEEYRRRMEQTVKEKRKLERLLKKPQYSNPLYFGHKRPPKKRPPGKMKYCKECGLRH